MEKFSSLKSKKILICITGGIAVYKIASLVNHFLKNGSQVKVIMTKAATEFVSPVTFQALLNDVVYTDLFDIKNPREVEHISLAKWADICLIAPATANTIGKIAHGIADNLLTTVVMALPQKTKTIIVPAMNTEMWNNPIMKNNINELKKYKKYIFINPVSGLLACRDEGIGKVADSQDILKIVSKELK
jgi:phosphopantothenoylcysteine decarboxylase/phosphopantothenate--cysteine ligase